MDNASLYISILSLVFSVIAIWISQRKLAIARETHEFNKFVKTKEWKDQAEARTKKVEVSIIQRKAPNLSNQMAWLIVEVSIINKSGFNLKVDTIEIAFIENGARLPYKLDNHYDVPSFNIVVPSRDTYKYDHAVVIRQSNFPREVFQNPIQAFVKDKEGDVFSSDLMRIDVH